MRPRLVTALVFAALIIASVRAAAAMAAPRIIIVTGPALAAPVILTTWEENAALLSGEELAFLPDDLLTWPVLDLGLFWGDGWGRYIAAGQVGALRPEQANQHGRLYIPPDGSAPFIILDPPGVPRRMSRAGVEVLRRRVALVESAGSVGNVPAERPIGTEPPPATRRAAAGDDVAEWRLGGLILAIIAVAAVSLAWLRRASRRRAIG